MDSILRKAFIYWRILGMIDVWERLERENLVAEGLREKALKRLIAKFDLDEPIEQFADVAYQEQLMETYGKDMGTSSLPICKAMVAAKAAAKVKPEYKSFAEMLTLNKPDLPSSYALQHWLRSRNTLEFLSVWEERNNQAFQTEQAAAFIEEAHSTNTTVTLKKWTTVTGAIGIVAIPGRYGGTYADPIIANDFESWLSPEHRYKMLTLFMKRGES